jgi:hypothetical protein
MAWKREQKWGRSSGERLAVVKAMSSGGLWAMGKEEGSVVRLAAVWGAASAKGLEEEKEGPTVEEGALVLAAARAPWLGLGKVMEWE